MQNEITTLFQQTVKLQRLASKLQGDLETERGRNAKAQKQLKRDVKGLQEEIMNLEQELQESENRNNVGEGRLSATKRNLEQLQGQAMNDLLARNKLETENKSLKAEIVDVQKKLDDYQSIKEQNYDLGNQVRSSEHKINQYLAIVEDTAKKANASEEKVTAELAAKEAMENHYKAKIAEQGVEITELRRHREKLEQSVARFQASVKTCWWHRFRAWKDRFRKRDRSGSWVSITDESAENIILRTYG
ncbi:hypothetical protein FANTH_6946 [Fusarium anthophilum]|uniref:Uncharacterized protein n=1 Tax=Fusarium anthophilum TaxID=48485 RepID=A0A8H4ZGF0_9HYPO|nr:hypothetical protein FANTH_6946 [Fusarium anthophilum]